MDSQLNHEQAKKLFLDALDGELVPEDSSRFESHLTECDPCRSGFQAYSQAVHRVRQLPRHRAPAGLATLVARRARRERPGSPRMLWLAHVQQRVPAEIVVILLLAVSAAVAVLLSLR